MNDANSPTVARPASESSQRDVDDDRQREGGKGVRDRRAERRRHRLAHVEAAQALVGALEAPRLVVLAAEDLDHLVALDGLLQHVHQVAHRRLRLARHAAQAPRQQAHEQRDRRPHRERDQRQLPVEVQQPGQQPDHRDRVLAPPPSAPWWRRRSRRRRRRRPSRAPRRSCGRRRTAPAGAPGARTSPRAGRAPRGCATQARKYDERERKDAAHQENADDARRRTGAAAHGLRAGTEAAVEQRLHQRREQRLGRRRRDHAEHREAERLGVGRT